MSDINPEHDALVFVPRSADGSFGCFMDLEAKRPKIYAFTSRKKAQTFLRVMSKAGFCIELDRLQPCTRSDWRECQQQTNDLHDLAIDAKCW